MNNFLLATKRTRFVCKTFFERHLAIPCFALALGYLPQPPAQALELGDWQVHGFASQAYLHSNGNNFYGESENGSSDFMEAGLNARWRLSSTLNFAAQIFTRDAGSTDNGDVNIDYLFADYRMIEQSTSGVGVRFGRVRNNYGLYNSTRDVIFTRPSILMPQAIYFEGNGLREILFASDGVELYSYWDSDSDSSSFSLTLGMDRRISEKVEENLLGAAASFAEQTEITSPIFAQFSHSMNGGDTRFAVSYLNLGLQANLTMPGFGEVRLDAEGLVVSAQRNFLNWTFTAELASLSLSYFASNQATEESRFDAFYLQSEYRFSDNISATLRAESTRADSEPSGNDTEEHFMMGFRWRPTPRWMLSADYYHLHGAQGIPQGDNPAGIEGNTGIYTIMIAYRF